MLVSAHKCLETRQWITFPSDEESGEVNVLDSEQASYTWGGRAVPAEVVAWKGVRLESVLPVGESHGRLLSRRGYE